jgi:hypothetical protein
MAHAVEEDGALVVAGVRELLDIVDAVKEGGFVHPEHGVASHREHGGLPSSSRGSDQAAPRSRASTGGLGCLSQKSYSQSDNLV